MPPQPAAAAPKVPAVPRPSASVLLISPSNQILLLHRVKTSTAFPSAHVFPGGNLSAFHEGVPEENSPERHRDGVMYRLAAIRETFEETGILLAYPAGKRDALLSLPQDVLDAGRKLVHGNKVRFADWLKQVGAEPDLDGLVPFTRWVTPTVLPKRFTTQMYVYLLPFDTTLALKPKHDGGLEHTAAEFDDPGNWAEKSKRGEIIVISPQSFLLNMLAQFFTVKIVPRNYAAERAALLKFLNTVPTGPSDHPTTRIPWCDKVMSPTPSGLMTEDGRMIITVDTPGPELGGSGRGGDWDRVVVSLRERTGPSEAEVVWRKDVWPQAVARAEAAKAKKNAVPPPDSAQGRASAQAKL